VAYLGATATGIALAAFAYSRSTWLSLILIAAVGLAMVAHMTSNNTLVQVLVPGELRGRVMAFHAMVFTGAMPVGALVAGVLANHLGAPAAVAMGGLGCMLGAWFFAVRFPAGDIEGRG
jgi:predicted MFS family arabinose efflux permease